MAKTSKTEQIHAAYVICKEIFEPSIALEEEGFNIEDPEEFFFYENVKGFFLRQKQTEFIEKGVY